MATQEKSKLCKVCRRQTLHKRKTFSGWAGLALSVFTMGLFLPIWLLLTVVQLFTEKYRCQTCGSAN